MKKLLMLLALLMCLLPALAEENGLTDWRASYEAPVLVTEPELAGELENYAREELAKRFPKLTEEQLADFTEVTIYTYSSREDWWAVTLYYMGCESVQMEFDVIRTEDGQFEIERVLPWDIEGLVELYDGSISREDALAVGRISLAAAMAEYAGQYPEEAKAVVERYGLAILDPSGFLTHEWFVSPLNQGGGDEPVRWSLNFVLPVDPQAGPDGEANPLWYRVEIDATTGAVISENNWALFSFPREVKEGH